jgi:uncharacterized membrane protein (UPF0182 family)
MAETLDAALLLLFGEGTQAVATRDAAREAPLTPGAAPAPAGARDSSARPAAAATAADLARRANEHFDRARAAQRADDWAAYGTEMRRLGEVLRQLDAQRGGVPK